MILGWGGHHFACHRGPGIYITRIKESCDFSLVSKVGGPHETYNMDAPLTRNGCGGSSSQMAASPNLTASPARTL